jgi:hypothetical protein
MCFTRLSITIRNHKSLIILNPILGLTEGRGCAVGEVGLAALDLHRPVILLAQISDTHSYLATQTKINIISPTEVG